MHHVIKVPPLNLTAIALDTRMMVLRRQDTGTKAIR